MAQLNQIGLPDKWLSTSIFNLCTPKQWKTIPTAQLKSEGYVVYGANGKIGFYDTFTHEKSTLMITCRGATCGNIHLSEPKAYINGNAMALDNLSPFVDVNYLQYFLKRFDFKNVISGSAQPQITQKGMVGIDVAVAPLPEQKRIVEKLDSLLAQVDTIQQRLNNLPDIIKRFRQSVLAAAVSGKLTEQWREVNEFSLDKSCILNAYEQGWELEKLKEFELKGKQPTNDKWKSKLPVPYEPEEEDLTRFGDFPKSWQFVSLDQVTRFVKDGPHFSPTYSKSGVPFISGRNVSIDGISFDTAKYISEELHEELSRRCKPLFGDILYTKGGTTGIACVNREKLDFNVWVHVAVLRVSNHELILPEYIQMALNSPKCFERSQFYTHGVANRDLGLKRMIKICFPIPVFEEQTEIVRLVEQYFALADTLEKNLANAKQRVDNLTQSILAKAFKGELVPQDPNDEPAEKLLERIKAARIEAEKLEKAAKASARKAAKASKAKK